MYFRSALINGKLNGISISKVNEIILNKINVSVIVQSYLSKYSLDIFFNIVCILRKINVSFIVQFCLAK